MSVTVPELMNAMVARLNRLPLLAGASRSDNDFPSSPWAFVRESHQTPTRYDKARAGEQVVYPMIDVVILVKAQQDQLREETRVDPLIAQVLDLFDVNAYGAVNQMMPELTGHVDRVWHEAPVVRGAIKWGAFECFGAVITMDAKFHRKAVAIALEDAP